MVIRGGCCSCEVLEYLEVREPAPSDDPWDAGAATWKISAQDLSKPAMVKTKAVRFPARGLVQECRPPIRTHPTVQMNSILLSAGIFRNHPRGHFSALRKACRKAPRIAYLMFGVP